MNESPLMESTKTIHLPQQSNFKHDTQKNIDEPIHGGAMDICYRYGYVVIIGLLIVYIFYYSYNSFCENQNSEPFIEKTIRTGIDDDRSFDVDAEVKRLSDLQEQYLRKLNNQRHN